MEKQHFALFQEWKDDLFFDEKTRRELSQFDLKNKAHIKEIEDRFYKELEFGTGGMRGVMGAGTNRINQYVIGKATAGLADYLLDRYDHNVCKQKGVAICYDTRRNSRRFAEAAASVLSAKGIKVCLFDSARPTPQLSFSVVRLGCLAGIMITASHNPKQYNGYKLYDEYGCQLVPRQVEKIAYYIEKITDYREINFDGDQGLVHAVDLTDEYVNSVMLQSRYQDRQAKASMRVVYTPLHGTGYVPVNEALSRAGFHDINIVDEQAITDGEFDTVVSPNPEDRDALELGISLAEKTNADIVIGTDPDCDRVGVAVKTGTETGTVQSDLETSGSGLEAPDRKSFRGYQLLTGNQIGALLVDFILAHTDLSVYQKPALVKTNVTSELGAEIAAEKGITVFTTLTGFKYIGEKITQFEQAKETEDKLRSYDYLFGYEESYGYLAGTYVRDKDAVVSSLLICEMAAFCKSQGKTLVDRLNELYEKFGYYYDALENFTLEGRVGLAKIASIMHGLRQSDNALLEDVSQVVDYLKPVNAEEGFGTLPASDVLKYILSDGSWVAIRPSGTEPKLKIYYSIKGKAREDAESKFLSAQNEIRQKLHL